MCTQLSLPKKFWYVLYFVSASHSKEHPHHAPTRHRCDNHADGAHSATSHGLGSATFTYLGGQFLELLAGLVVSRFPGVPTVRRSGFPYCKEGLLNAGSMFYLFFGQALLGREGD